MGKRAKLFEIGEKIGVVTVVERVYNEARREWEYVCECKCGNRFKTRRDHLLKPRLGCKNCINKVSGDIDLLNTISEEEYRMKVEAKNSAKLQKKAEIEERKKERKRIKEQRLAELEEKKKKFRDTLLSSPIWIGQKFGRLTVIDSYTKDNKTYWVMKCDCGNVIDRVAKLVKFGHYISCGCLAKEISANAVSNERLYGIWNGMKDRCLNPNNPNYRNYGGRGIKVCDEWKDSYRNFREWAYKNGWTEEIPKEHKFALSIERKNVNGNYEPSNCCFIPLYKQSENKRPYCERERIKTWKDREFLEINGETKTYREWQKFYGFTDNALIYRRNVMKLSGAEIFTTKRNKRLL